MRNHIRFLYILADILLSLRVINDSKHGYKNGEKGKIASVVCCIKHS